MTTEIKKQPPAEQKLIQEKARLVLNRVEESEESDLGRAYMEYCEQVYTSEELAKFHDEDNVQEPFDKAQEMYLGLFDDLETALKAHPNTCLLYTSDAADE